MKNFKRSKTKTSKTKTSKAKTSKAKTSKAKTTKAKTYQYFSKKSYVFVSSITVLSWRKLLDDCA